MTEIFLAEARRVAEENRYDQVTPEHLLYVLLRDERHMDEAARIGLDPNMLLSMLSAGFGFHRSGRLLSAHRTFVKPELTGALTRAREGGATLLSSVLDLFDPNWVDAVTPAPEISDPVPDLDELLEVIEGEQSHMGFNRICRDVFHKDAHTSRPSSTDRDVPDDTQADIPERELERRKSEGERTSLSGKERAEAQRAVERSIRDLTDLHRAGRLDPVIGREPEIDHICEVLMRRRKSNVLLVGEPGVGKTALIEGVASRIAESSDLSLSARPVLQVSLGALVAGARYRGDFEIRMELLVDLATERRAVLFFDEMQMLIGAGATSERGMDGANMLKPVLARDGLSLIGATTNEEAQVIRSDPALMRRFEEIPLEEPDPDLMREILRGGSASYLAHHRVRADDRVLSRLVDFADRYLTGRRFPDKAFDLLDSACVRARLSGHKALRVEHLRDAVRRLGGALPAVTTGRMESMDAEEGRLISRIERHVGGHPEAIRQIAHKVSAQEPGAPVLLRLDGPDGVGRRTLAFSLARALGGRLTELSATEPVSRIQEVLLETSRSSRPLILLLTAEGEMSAEIRSLLSRIASNGEIMGPNGRERPISRTIILLRSKGPQTQVGFRFSQESNQKDIPFFQKISMSSFSGDRLEAAVSFELDRLSELWSDSGASRPIPDVKSVLSRLPSDVSSWSEIVSACRSCAED